MAQQPIDLGTAPNDGTGDPLRGGGEKINDNFTEVYGLLTTREFQRASVELLLFDKNELGFITNVVTTNITFELAEGGHLVDQYCSSLQRRTFDGTNSVNFGAGITPIGITNGGVPPAGTYYISFVYWNGEAIANFMMPSTQQAGIPQLAAPGSLAVVADGENALDISWTNVTSNQGYLVEASADGVSGWATVETTAVDAVASTITGLSAGDTRFIRVTTLGNGTTSLNSGYATAAGSTASGSGTPPTFTFLPVDTATDVVVNEPLVITANRAIRNTDTTAITDNQAGIITLKETNSGGANIAHTWTIDPTKTFITISPTAGYGGTQLVYAAIDNVEDTDGNEVTVAESITFTTNNYTRKPLGNVLKFGDILDSVLSANDGYFKLRITLNDLLLTNDFNLVTKYSLGDNQRSFAWYTLGNNDLKFTWSADGTGAARVVTWTDALGSPGPEIELELEYFGAIDTAQGLDRLICRRDGNVLGGKALTFQSGGLPKIFDSTAQLAFGGYVSNDGAIAAAHFIEQAKDLQILSVGDVMELNVPVLIEGTDISGNARHGTWV